MIRCQLPCKNILQNIIKLENSYGQFSQLFIILYQKHPILSIYTHSRMKSASYKPLSANSKLNSLSQDSNSKKFFNTKSVKQKQHEKEKLKTQQSLLQVEREKKKVYKTKSQRLSIFQEHKNYQLKTCPDLQQSATIKKRTPKSANNKYPQSKFFPKANKITKINSKKNTLFCRASTLNQTQSIKKHQESKPKKKRVKTELKQKRKSFNLSKTEQFLKQNHFECIKKQTKSFFLFEEKKLIGSLMDCESSAISARRDQSRVQIEESENKIYPFIHSYLNSVDMRIMKTMKNDFPEQKKKLRIKQIYDLQQNPIIYYTKIKRIPLKKLESAVIKIQRFWRRVLQRSLKQQYKQIFSHIFRRDFNKKKEQKHEITPSSASMLYVTSKSSSPELYDTQLITEFQDYEEQQLIKLIKVEQQNIKQESSVSVSISQSKSKSIDESEVQFYKPYIDFGTFHEVGKMKPQLMQKMFVPTKKQKTYMCFNDYLNDSQQNQIEQWKQNYETNVDKPLSGIQNLQQSSNIISRSPNNQLFDTDICNYTDSYDIAEKKDQKKILSLQEMEGIEKYYDKECDKIAENVTEFLISQMCEMLLHLHNFLNIYMKYPKSVIQTQKDSENKNIPLKQQEKMQENEIQNEVEIVKQKNKKKSKRSNIIPDEKVKDERLQRIQINEISLNFYLEIIIQIILNNYSYVLQIYDNMQYSIKYNSYYFLKFISENLPLSYSDLDCLEQKYFKSRPNFSMEAENNQSVPNRMITISQKIHKQCCQYIQLINHSQSPHLLNYWYQCIHGSFNQFLKQYRPYGLNSPNYPWSSSLTIPHYFQLADLGGVLELVRSKIIYLMGYQVGTLFDKKNMSAGIKMMDGYELFELNEQKMICYLSEWIEEDERNWVNFDTQKLVILLQISQIVYNLVIDQVLMQINSIPVNFQSS